MQLRNVLGLLAAMLPVASLAQEAFAPIPPAIAPKYHFDFSRNFFSSPEVEKAQRTRFYATLKSLESMKGKVAASADNLLKTLQLNDQVQSLFNPHYMYLYLRYAVNTKDTASRDVQNALGAELDRRTAFLQQELMRIDDAKFARFVQHKPELAKYRFVIQSAARLKPHTLSLKEEE